MGEVLTGAFIDPVVEYDGGTHLLPETTEEIEIDAHAETVTFGILVKDDLEALRVAKLVDEDDNLKASAVYDRLLIRVFDSWDDENADLLKTIELRDVAANLEPIVLPYDGVVVAHVVFSARDGIGFIDEADERGVGSKVRALSSAAFSGRLR